MNVSHHGQTFPAQIWRRSFNDHDQDFKNEHLSVRYVFEKLFRYTYYLHWHMAFMFPI